MKTPLIVTTAAVVVLVAAVGYLAISSITSEGGSGPPTKVTVCKVGEVPFGVGLSSTDLPDFDPIHMAEPAPISLPAVLALHDGSGLDTSWADLCEGTSKPGTPGSPCDGIDSFSFGLDWIPLMPGGDDHFWTLSDFSSGGGPGWAILFYTNGNDVFALGWGQATGGGSGNLLRKTWPSVDPVTGETINAKLMDMTETPPASPTTLHRGEAIVPRAGMVVDGLDFHAWVPQVGPKPPWNEFACFQTPSGMADVEPRLLYTLDRPASGTGSPSDGAVIWVIEPQALEDGSFIWSAPVELCTNTLPGIPREANIVALGYYELPDTPAGEEDRAWLNQELELDGDMQTVAGLVIYALDPESYEGGGVADPFEAGEPFYIAPVIADAAGSLTYGSSRPVMTHLPGVPLRDVVGPRSRGVCPVDPRFLVGRAAAQQGR